MAMAAATGGSVPLHSALRNQVYPPATALTVLCNTSTQPRKVVSFVDDGWTETSGKGLAHADVHTYVVEQDACWLSETTSGGHDRPGLEFGSNAADWRHKGGSVHDGWKEGRVEGQLYN